MGLAKGHAGTATGDQTGVDRSKAAEKSGKPGLRSAWRPRVEVLRWTGEYVMAPI